MYSIQWNTNKKLGQRDNAITEQSDRITKQKTELDRLQKRWMESEVQQLKQDKGRLRHKAQFWRDKSQGI